MVNVPSKVGEQADEPQTTPVTVTDWPTWKTVFAVMVTVAVTAQLGKPKQSGFVALFTFSVTGAVLRTACPSVPK